MTYEISTASSEATQSVAQQLSRFLSGGETIELVSDLGGGKTTFVQGLAAALGYKKPVTSPTFTISNIYQLPSGKELHHYDLYRLGETGILGQELLEDLTDPDVITVIEWAGIAQNLLPQDRLTITFEVRESSARKLTFSSSGAISDQIVTRLTS